MNMISMKQMCLGLSLALLAACGQTTKTEGIDGASMAEVAVFTSADKDLEKTYNWAKEWHGSMPMRGTTLWATGTRLHCP